MDSSAEPDTDSLIAQYDKLIQTIKTSRQIALDTIKQAKAMSASCRGENCDDYSLSPEEYIKIEDYYKKIL
jgi:hypothetical protein